MYIHKVIYWWKLIAEFEATFDPLLINLAISQTNFKNSYDLTMDYANV